METESLLKPPKSKLLKAGRVVLSRGEEIGEHVTEKKEEIIIVLRGTATIILEGKKAELSEGRVYFIEKGKVHNVKNNSNRTLEYIYVVALLNNTFLTRNT